MISLSVIDPELDEGCFKKKTMSFPSLLVFTAGGEPVVDFLVGSEPCTLRVQAPRNVLATKSPAFKAMLLGHDPPRDEILVTDVGTEDFVKMLRYLYNDGGDIENHEEAINLYSPAKRFMVTSLERACIEYLENNLTLEEACRVYEFATKTGLTSLIYNYEHIFVDYTEEVLNSTGFMSASIETVTTIVKKHFLAIPSEFYLYSALLRWSEKVCSGERNCDLRTVLEPILPHIRFLFMSRSEIVTANQKFPVLKEKEIASILHAIDEEDGSSQMDTFPRTQEEYKSPSWEDSVTNNLKYRRHLHCGNLVGAADKLFSFSVEAISDSLFLCGFSLFLRYEEIGSFIVKAVVSLTISGRFKLPKLVKQLSIEGGDGACFIYFPRAIFLTHRETLMVALEFLNVPSIFLCEVQKSPEFYRHRVIGSGETCVVGPSKCSTTQPVTILDVSPCYRRSQSVN